MMTSRAMLALLALTSLLLPGPARPQGEDGKIWHDGQWYDEVYTDDLDEAWYNSDKLPDVNLTGLIKELSAKISWFKYVGEATLQCSERAKQQDTLMLAIEDLHACLFNHYQECDSIYTDENVCEPNLFMSKPCGTFRFGLKTLEATGYAANSDCRWMLEVPEGFVMNLTIDEFHLEASGPRCSYDYMVILDMLDRRIHTRYGPYCGSRPAFTVYGTGRRMHIVAHTDDTIGKLGFRGVFQVMDPGIGENLNGTYNIPAGSGNISLASFPPSRYDTYIASYYYTEWLIRAQYGHKVKVSLDMVLRNGAITEIFDGPVSWNKGILKVQQGLNAANHSGLYNGTEYIENGTAEYDRISTGFQMLVVLQEISKDDNSSFFVRYEAVEEDIDQFEHALDQRAINHTCNGPAQIDLMENETVRIFVSEATPSTNQGILCFWNIRAPPDMFVQVHMTQYDFRGPNVDNCVYEGMVFLNGENFTDDQLVGPFCYSEPKGLFVESRNGVTDVTSSGENMIVHFYSYTKKPFVQRPGYFRAVVRATPCQGVIQPCSSPVQEKSEFYETTLQYYAPGPASLLNYTFSCEKSKCCILQQFPVYGRLNSSKCSIQVVTHGDLLLATSKFTTHLNRPNKMNSTVHYACQMTENSEPYDHGSHRTTCKGTLIQVVYNTRSTWAMAAFTLQVERADCGYYRPDLHAENLFFPPCAQAEIPVSTNVSTVRYLDPTHENYMYYSMVFKYKSKQCDRPCGNTVFKIIGNNTFVGWSRPSPMPFSWKTWGRTTDSTSWMRYLRIIRDVPPECAEDTTLSDACEISVDFRTHKLENTQPRPRINYSCPAGYELVDTSCYILAWSGLSENGTSLVESYNMSVREAADVCRKNGSFLFSINSKREHDNILLHFYYVWWNEYFQYIPGRKIFHLGIEKTEQGEYKWMNGQPVHYTLWNIPDYSGRLPDIAGFSLDEEPIPAIASASLKESIQWMHPRPDQEGDCAAVVIANIHAGAQWTKMKCDEPIIGAIPICEHDPIFEGSAHLPLVNSMVNLTVTTTIQETEEGTRMLLPDQECPKGFTSVGSKCFALVSNPHTTDGTVKEQTPKSSCPLHFPETEAGIATVTEDDLENLNRVMSSWQFTAQSGSIRVRHIPDTANYSQASADDTYNKFILEAITHYLGPDDTDPVLQWVLTDIRLRSSADSYLVRKRVYSYLCEAPLLNITEVCSANHFECSDGTCIMSHMQCDGHQDCLSGNDENNCTEICWWTNNLEPRYAHIKPGTIPENRIHEDDLYRQKGADRRFVYTPGPPLSTEQLLGVWNDNCFNNCPKENCTCSNLYYQCETGGCIPASKLCDFFDDCLDGSDEKICNYLGSDGPEKYMCQSGQCVDAERRCNFIPDCFDGTDEENCFFNETCPLVVEITTTTEAPDIDEEKVEAPSEPSVYFQCGEHEGGKACIPADRENDRFPDCPGPMPTDENVITNAFGSLDFKSDGTLDVDHDLWCPERPTHVACHPWLSEACVHRSETCLYTRNELGDINGCRDGAHIAECATRECGSGYKCPGSYCLALDRVCDGTPDCDNGEDESQCENFHCPGMFQCRGESRCVRQSQVCDGRVDCPRYHDDETLCSFRQYGCPTGCQCLGRAVTCAGNNISSTAFLANTDREIRVLVLRNNAIQTVSEVLADFTQLYLLDLSYNKLQSFSEARFDNMHMLQYLYMDNNELGNINLKHFKGLWNLKVLTLTNNQISMLGKGVFTGLRSLSSLDLSGQDMKTLAEYFFAGLENTKVINLTYNRIESVENRSFCDLDHRERPIALKHVRFLDIRHNRIKTAEPDAFKFLPPEAMMYADRFKFCCFARHIKECYPPPDEFSSCDDLVANKGLRVFVWAIGILSVIGNVVVLHQRMKHEKETTPSLLVQHLAFSDLVMGLYCIIIVSADEFMRGRYIFSADSWRAHALCKLAAFFSMLSSEMSMYTLMLITLDRVLAVMPFCNSRGISIKAVRGFIALGWTITAILSVLPILEFGYFKQEGFVRSGVCTLFNITKGRMSGWEFSMGIFLCMNFAASLVMALGYSCVWNRYMKGASSWSLPEDLTEDERETELTFRRNELLITRRLVLIVVTNCMVWLPMVGVGVFALLGFYVDKVFSAWIAMFFMPLNAALNPFLYTLNTRPYRILLDDLLANWVEMEAEDDDEDEDAEKEETRVGSVGVATSTSGKTESTAASEGKPREGALTDIL